MAVQATTRKGSPSPPTRPNPSHFQASKEAVGPSNHKEMAKGQKPVGG